MAFLYDFEEQYIYVPAGDLNIQDLLNDIRQAEQSEVGILYPQIATASGKETLGGGVSIGMTLNLINWQLKFPDAPDMGYTVRIYGGNLVGGVNGNTIAYSDGVQVLIVQSAASTIVTQSSGSGLSAEQDTLLRQAVNYATSASLNSANAMTEAKLSRKMQTNKAVISGDGLSVIIYEDDGVTPLWLFDVSSDKLTRIGRLP